jgi:signal transduction histidine kinase
MKDTAQIALIAMAAAGGVGVVGLLILLLLRRLSMWVSLAAVALITVLALVAGVVATAKAMFLSGHDFRVVLVVCVAAGIVSLAVALVLGRQVVAGGRALRDAARAFGTGERFSPPPTPPPTAELAALSHELEATSARLTESRRRERALEASRRELVAWVSHDLRTPLAGLRAMAESLEDAIADDPARYHKQIRVEVDRLSAMVDDLFELSCIHAGALRLSVEQVSLADLVSDTVAGADALAQSRGVRLLGQAAGRVVVRGDGREISRALSNLVINAIRHTPSDGTVEVSATSGEDGAVLAVSDGCGGLADADLDRIFDIGWRGSNARTPGPDQGAGLGLAIARGIVEAHAGRISVGNTRTGCRFEVVLPAAGR